MFGMGGMTDRGGGGPLDFLRGRVDNWRAHPFQNMLATFAGGVGGPAGSQLASSLFGRYNDSRFNNSAQQAMGGAQQLGDQASQQAFDKPFTGPRAEISGLPGALGAPDFQDQNRQLGQALTGGGGGQSFGGPVGNQQNWNLQQLSGFNPHQGDPISQLLGFLPQTQAPGLPTIPGVPMSHQDRLDYRQGLGNNGAGMSANYGISPMMANGQNMITGFTGNDMNQLRVRGRTPGY